MAETRVIISGGGTGGHIFPAIAIANAIKKKRPEAQILFVGAEGRMEMEKVPEAGYEIKGLPIMGIQRRLTLKNLKFPFMLLKSMLKARSIVKSFQPQVAVGVGGYASGPLLRAASNAGLPTLIQEQNSYAGLTNKILGKKASKICVAYEGMDSFFPAEKIILTGNPVRSEVVKLEGKRERAFEFFQLDPNKKTLLIVGGSLGAWSVNEGVANALDQWEQEDLQVIWQCGKVYHEKALEAVKGRRGIKVLDFIKRMDLAYAAADLVVSRAGALAVSELCLVKKPSIFVPLPTAAEDHQNKNAQALTSRNAAYLIPDSEVRSKLKDEVSRLIASEEELQRTVEQIKPLGYEDAADIIADEVLKLIKE